MSWIEQSKKDGEIKGMRERELRTQAEQKKMLPARPLIGEINSIMEELEKEGFKVTKKLESDERGTYRWDFSEGKKEVGNIELVKINWASDPTKIVEITTFEYHYNEYGRFGDKHTRYYPKTPAELREMLIPALSKIISSWEARKVNKPKK